MKPITGSPRSNLRQFPSPPPAEVDATRLREICRELLKIEDVEQETLRRIATLREILMRSRNLKRAVRAERRELLVKVANGAKLAG